MIHTCAFWSGGQHFVYIILLLLYVLFSHFVHAQTHSDIDYGLNYIFDCSYDIVLIQWTEYSGCTLIVGLVFLNKSLFVSLNKHMCPNYWNSPKWWRLLLQMPLPKSYQGTRRARLLSGMVLSKSHLKQNNVFELNRSAFFIFPLTFLSGYGHKIDHDKSGYIYSVKLINSLTQLHTLTIIIAESEETVVSTYNIMWHWEA